MKKAYEMSVLCEAIACLEWLCNCLAPAVVRTVVGRCWWLRWWSSRFDLLSPCGDSGGGLSCCMIDCIFDEGDVFGDGRLGEVMDLVEFVEDLVRGRLLPSFLCVVFGAVKKRFK
jgi:hypothetical protein